MEFDAPSLLHIPYWLKKLEFEPFKKNRVLSAAKANSILDLCNNLTEVKISSDPVHISLIESHASDYEKYFIGFCEEILLNLFKKPNMTALSICMSVASDDTMCFHDMPSLGVVSSDVLPTTYSAPQFLTSLQVIDIEMKKLTTRELTIWKSFLDCQLRLTSLRVYVGFVYWEYFVTVLQNNYMTLKSVDIEVSNLDDAFRRSPWATVHDFIFQTDPNSEVFTRQDSWLDWTKLFGQDCRLKSLSLYMPLWSWGNRTKNFCLSWAFLEKLNLHFNSLTQEEWSRVLLELPLLRKIQIEWIFYLKITERFREFLRLLQRALQLNHLDEIQVSHNFFSSLYSREEVSQILNHPNYVVTFRKINRCLGLAEHLMPTHHM